MPKSGRLAAPQGNEKALSPVLANPKAQTLGWPGVLEELAFGAVLAFDLFLMASCPDEQGKVILGMS